MNYPSEDHAITAKRIFEREDLQFKIIKKIYNKIKTKEKINVT